MLASLPVELLQLVMRRLPLESLLALRACARTISGHSMDAYITGWHVPLDRRQCPLIQPKRMTRLVNLTHLKIDGVQETPYYQFDKHCAEAIELRTLTVALLPMHYVTSLTRLTLSKVHISSVVLAVSRVASACLNLSHLVVVAIPSFWIHDDDWDGDRWAAAWSAMALLDGLQRLDVSGICIPLESFAMPPCLSSLRLYDNDNDDHLSIGVDDEGLDWLDSFDLTDLRGLIELSTNFIIKWAPDNNTVADAAACLSGFVYLELSRPAAAGHDAYQLSSAAMWQHASALTQLTRLVMPQLSRLPSRCGLTQLVVLEAKSAYVPACALQELRALTRLVCRMLQAPPADSRISAPALRSLRVWCFCPGGPSASDTPLVYGVPAAVLIFMPTLESLTLTHELCMSRQAWFDNAEANTDWFSRLWVTSPSHALRCLTRLAVEGLELHPLVVQACSTGGSLTALSFTHANATMLPAVSSLGDHLQKLELSNVSEPVLRDMLQLCPVLRSLVIIGAPGACNTTDEVTTSLAAAVPASLRHVTLTSCLVSAASVAGVQALAATAVETIVLDQCRGITCEQASQVRRQSGRFWLDIIVC